MFFSIWLLGAGLAVWAGGKIAGDDGFGTAAGIPPFFSAAWKDRKIKIRV